MIIKFPQIAGLCNKKNDLLIFSKQKLSGLTKLVIFFHGDIQNYEEEMIKFNYSRPFVQWSLERSMKLIGDKFPDHAVLAVKSSQMTDQFARYNNFIDYDDQLVKYRKDFDALQHLEQLISNLRCEIEFNEEFAEVDFDLDKVNEMILVGFSKGGVIVNQIMISLYELKSELERSAVRKQHNLAESEINLSTTDSQIQQDFTSRSNSRMNSCSRSNSMSFKNRNSRNSFCSGLSSSLSSSFNDNKIFFEIVNDAVNKRLEVFFKKISTLIWLDLGCNAVNDEVYILNDKILQNIMDSNIRLQVHATARQIRCNQRPHIGEQENAFSEKFKDYEKYKRKLYLDKSSTIQTHFELLEDFVLD